ncbi:MAG: hypothetical protein JXR90_12975 [Spirochaetes bacterium]|nr:hypothetical protein [Spirochaetota bacterium]
MLKGKTLKAGMGKKEPASHKNNLIILIMATLTMSFIFIPVSAASNTAKNIIQDSVTLVNPPIPYDYLFPAIIFLIFNIIIVISYMRKLNQAESLRTHSIPDVNN